MKKNSNIRLKANHDSIISQRKYNNDIINSLCQKNEVSNNKDREKTNNINVSNFSDRNNELSLINNNLLKNMMIIKNNDADKKNS